MIYVTGDLHAHLDIDKLMPKLFPQGLLLTKKDYVIILGDFGILWQKVADDKEKKGISYLDSAPWTTLFIDGNHENFDRIDNLKQVKKFGSGVGKVSKSIYHLKRGEIYTIENKKIFTFGGGSSIDKRLRTEGLSWWSREMPSKKEMDRGLKNLQKNNNEVDYVMSHTCPSGVFDSISGIFGFSSIVSEEMNLRNYFDNIVRSIKFKKWYFGHFHYEADLGKFQMLYRDKVLLGETAKSGQEKRDWMVETVEKIDEMV